MNTALSVAIIGSGPSGFYAAKALLRQSDVPVRIYMFDKLPTPYGLVRSGVAPDHQSIKGVVKMYEKVASSEAFTFIGNVRIGVDVSAEAVRATFDAVIWAVGNENARTLGIPGEALQGVYSATEFVFWYNGHPEYQAQRFDFSTATRALVVGNGNVAMDVTRILVRQASELSGTDISLEAHQVLEQSTIQQVSVLARRGVAQAAFSPKEIKEIMELEGVQVTVSSSDAALETASIDWLESGQAPRNAQKNIDLLQECVDAGPNPNGRTVSCVFRTSPVAFLGENGVLSRVRMRKNRIELRDGMLKPVGTSEEWEEEVDVVFQAIGYRGIPIAGVPFDERRGIIPNCEGRVLTGPGGTVCDGEYVVGWAKRGPSGLIGTNGPDSKATIEKLLEDVQSGRIPTGNGDRIQEWLSSLPATRTTFDDWRTIDALEVQRGHDAGKVRLKYTDVSSMLAVLNDRQ